MDSKYVGYWTGEFEGTNQGGLAIDIRVDNNKLTGIAKLNEADFGQYEYVLSGSIDVDPLS
ncbi:MAG: hypothetical protein H7Z73_03055 [Candidatus Saccharibacteria bacterium]|nr:hypothetical protein [Moraxellaceae bacterium]